MENKIEKGWNTFCISIIDNPFEILVEFINIHIDYIICFKTFKVARQFVWHEFT